ncbi:MAG TPA: hypothetical protein DCG75_18460 [Bacteroidales bacterium]|jgi:uncharacterized protein YicC (UPF0701 family)|nr:hypothetical protein [Bacteroidales bacterium]
MKKTVRIITSFALVLSIALFSACNTSQKESEKTTTDQLKELQSDLNSLNTSIENLSQTENEKFKEEALKIIDDFNFKISNFENQLRVEGKQIDENTQQALDELKASMKNIETKLIQLNNETQGNFTEIKSEIKHDFTEFGKSIKNFFDKNI